MDTAPPAPVIRRYPVQSSNLAEIGYDPGTLTLEVVFQVREGRPAPVWRYQPVSPETYVAIMNAESIGQAFNKLVKQESTKPNATVQARRVGAPAGEGVTLSLAEMTAACANIGLDLTCGGCAAQFFTGIGAPCSPGCKTVRGGDCDHLLLDGDGEQLRCRVCRRSFPSVEAARADRERGQRAPLSSEARS